MKAEPTEGSPQGEESETKDEHMDATAKDNKGLERTEEFKYFCEVIFPGEERGSPMRKLIEQKNGYPTSGLYHSGVRGNPVSAFKVQHMAWHVKTDPHPMTRYTLSENDLFKHMCTMDPIYERYPAKKDVVFRSGDVRSTLDDQLMEKASNVNETALEVQEALLEKAISLSRSGNPASREELLNAMLHFSAELVSMKMRSGTCHLRRCRSLKGALVKSLAQSKSQLFMACEASEVNQEELKFFARSWLECSQESLW